MKLRVFKPGLLVLTALFVIITAGFGQSVSVSVSSASGSASVKLKNGKKLRKQITCISKSIEKNLEDIGDSLSGELDNIAPQIIANVSAKVKLRVKNGDASIDLNFDDSGKGDSYGSGNSSVTPGKVKEKNKSYSKSYPIDGNDRIDLTNQYGRIAVTTWDRHEVKVDVQIKAQATDEDEAQKLLDAVQIRDNKAGDVVTFSTQIGTVNNSWKLFNWSDKKKHKVEIDYTVYMPAKTDLTVENSFGAIILPNLDGRIKLSASYGSVTIQNLSNPANKIEGSYGNMKIGSLNGGKLAFSYGDVSIDECTNLKAELSYGSFSLGRLKGAAEIDLSNVSGFRIKQIAPSFRKLDINSSYSSVALGVADNNNFDFDITTTYGGFNYNDRKVNITSKTPADGSHYSNTQNYKGRFGGGGAAQVSVHSSYGGVKFE